MSPKDKMVGELDKMLIEPSYKILKEGLCKEFVGIIMDKGLGCPCVTR